jgi:hypothetical protein
MAGLLTGFHNHHVKPKYMGGDNTPENLVLLHPIDHAIAHLVRFKMFGDVRDKWASNWLQNIVDPSVYTDVAIQREKLIKEKRSTNTEFDRHMRKVRSDATKNRKEGYQKAVGEAFKNKFNSDPEYANYISTKRAKAQEASSNVIRLKSLVKAKKVLEMRSAGAKYDDIKKSVGCSMGFISKVVNCA